MFCQGFDSVRTLLGKDVDHSTLVICFMAALCAVLPLDISQLSFALIGAALYAILYKSDQTSAKRSKASKTTPSKADSRVSVPKTVSNNLSSKSKVVSVQQVAGPEVRKASSQPVLAPSFQSQSWEGEVHELLGQIAPTAAVEEVVKKLEQLVVRNLEKVLPGVEITGFAHGNLNVSKAFGVAVPDVEIVARVSPQVVFSCLHGYAPQLGSEDLDVLKLQKSAIRACADRLVSVAGFKFRRSAFRGQQPKVTLLVPQTLGIFTESFPIDFSVNVTTPFYNAALLAECGQMDERARQLILLVRRWAKDRGICHSAKGHLSPYIWGLLSIYFLQVGDDEEGPLLPPVDQFAMVAGSGEELVTAPRFTKKISEKSAATLFKEFAHFFSTQFDWSKEAVSVRSGKRAPPRSEIPIHKVSSGTVGPTIEDPFQKAHNLGDCMTVASLARLKEELTRARELCTSNASLTELLEPWAPDAPEEEDMPQKPPKEEPQKSSGQEAQLSGAATKTPPWRREKPAAV